MDTLELIKEQNEYFEYVGSIIVKDQMVNIYLDDYGQCYAMQYYSPKTQKLEVVGLGTYNTDWEEEVKEYFKSDFERLEDRCRTQRDMIRDIQKELYDIKNQPHCHDCALWSHQSENACFGTCVHCGGQMRHTQDNICEFFEEKVND